MKHTIVTTLGAVLVSTAFLTTMSAAKDEREEINQVYQAGKDARLSLSNLNGGVRITAWDKNTIEVKAVKTTSGPRELLDEVTVKMRMNDDHLRIEVEYDFDDDRSYHDGDLVEVEFEINVPRGIRVDAVELVNGNLDVSGVEGDVDASSVNGEVTGARLAGDVQLSAVNGDVSLTGIVGYESIRLSSVNGSVAIVLPREVNAKLTASTVHGEVHGDLGHGVTHAGSSLDAVLGSGGARIDLGTVNGDIRIRRADGNDARKRDASRDSGDDSE